MEETAKFKKVPALVLGFTLLFSQVTFGATVPPDVSGKPYEPAIAALFDKGIITGDENGLFNPDQTLTRAQACVIVVKSMNPPIGEVAGTATQDVIKSGFPDMSGYSWAEGYIRYAVKKGVTKGYPNGTFKPGNKVSSNELITMILRGAGYFDASMEGTWPLNYKTTGEKLKLYAGLPSQDGMPEFATKWMASQMAFNGLTFIEKANLPETSPVFGTPKTLPDLEGLTYMINGSFDTTISTFGGLPLSDQVQVFTCLEKKDYGMEMVLPLKATDYLTENIYKYKRVVTPAFYRTSNGGITAIILPKDVGYTGFIYGVVNDTLNGLSTLTASREIHWAAGIDVKKLVSGQTYLDGKVFKLTSLNGKIQKMESVPDMASGYGLVEDYKIKGPVQISVNEISRWVEISGTPTVYLLNTSQGKYRISSTASIKEGAQIKLFDVSDDDENKADIIVIKE